RGGGGGGGGGGAAPGAAPLTGAAPGSDERVLLTAFDVIPAVAASRRMVYVATPDGIGVLDRTFRRWLPPLTRLGGYRGGPVTAIAADPVEDGVWVATTGAIAYYRPTIGTLTGTVVPGVIDAIVFDQRDPAEGAFVHASGGWTLVSHTGLASAVTPARLPPPEARVQSMTLGDVYRAYPALQATAPLLTRDAELRSWPVIAGTKVPDQSEVWLGTEGGGLFRVDPLFSRGEQYPFGLLETGAGALAPAADGVWIGGLGRSRVGRSGLTFASTDLQQWRWVGGSVAQPLGGVRANRLAVRGTTAWIAGDHGLVRLDTRDPTRALAWSAGNGLPSDAALSVIATAGGAWVGTARGLAFVATAPDARAARAADVRGPIARDTPVRALLLAGDTLWIGSDAGLLLLRGAAPDSAPRRIAVTDARLARPVRALARSDSLVAVATANDLVVLDPHRAAVVHRFDAVDPSLVRGINALAMDAKTLWVAGDGGVLVIPRANAASRILPVPAVVPAQAYDVLLDDDYAWIATPAGVLRLRRLSDGTVR
ncbi:MAG: hypothetical protein IRY91_10705, partial [Gemmatimonadaceae bacterium]|nr:hypothetical protein [Gemmatimonadaceae bacterium]